jgi:hypothetical protein
LEAIDQNERNHGGLIVPFGSAVLAAEERQIQLALRGCDRLRKFEDLASLSAGVAEETGASNLLRLFFVLFGHENKS